MYKDPMKVLGNPLIAGKNGIPAVPKGALFINVGITIPYEDLVKQINNEGLQKLLDATLKEISKRGLKA